MYEFVQDYVVKGCTGHCISVKCRASRKAAFARLGGGLAISLPALEGLLEAIILNILVCGLGSRHQELAT